MKALLLCLLILLSPLQALGAVAAGERAPGASDCCAAPAAGDAGSLPGHGALGSFGECSACHLGQAELPAQTASLPTPAGLPVFRPTEGAMLASRCVAPLERPPRAT